MKRVAMVFFASIGISCGAFAAETQAATSDKQVETRQDTYVPGMGEIMSATQMRHLKLWLAGKSKNWSLAGYELDEIREGLDDATKFHPVFKKGAPIAAMLEKFTTPPLNELARAIESKDSKKFRSSFGRLTGACNACHQAAGREFIVIKRPGMLPFSNQEFTVKH